MTQLSYLLGNVHTVVVFYGKYCMSGVTERLIQDKVKLNTKHQGHSLNELIPIVGDMHGLSHN